MATLRMAKSQSVQLLLAKLQTATLPQAKSQTVQLLLVKLQSVLLLLAT
jgi:hypothetical protein